MNLLAIGAHPDDIEFGCGGTLIKHSRRGDNIYLLVLTEGEAGSGKNLRRREQECAARFLNVRKVYWGDFQDTKIPINKKSIGIIEKAAYKFAVHNYKI